MTSFTRTYFIFPLSLYLGGFWHFAIRWYSYPHLKYLRGVRYVRLFSESPASRSFSFSFLIFLKHFLQSDFYLHKMCTLSEQHALFHYSYQNLSCCQYLGNQFLGMKCSMIFDLQIFFSPLLCLVASYLRRIFSTLVKVFQKCVHKLILRIAVSYWNW